MEPTLKSPITRPVVRALLFFAVLLLLYAFPGQLAQAANLPLGLAWTELFAFLLPAFAFAAGFDLRPTTFLMLAKRPTTAQLLLGFFCGAASCGAAGALMALTAPLLPRHWLELFDLSHLFQGSLLQRILLGLLASTLAPLCEEAAFRGFLQNTLRARFAPWIAIVVSAFLFAAMHLDPVRFIAVFALGVLFGWLAWRSGSLWPAVIAHAANNGITTAFTISGVVELGQQLAQPRSALLTLLVTSIPLALLCMAYRAATPSPPALENVLVSSESGGFGAGRFPPWLTASATSGLLLLMLLAALARGRP